MEFNFKGFEIDGITYFVNDEMIEQHGTLENAARAIKESTEKMPLTKGSKKNVTVDGQTPPPDPTPDTSIGMDDGTLSDVPNV